jgi:flagellar hook-associated protein 3 FlgL
MRISTNQIYESGTLGIQSNQSGLYRLQNQLSTGRRILSPEDDPVAAAQALTASQSVKVEGQYIENQGNARSQLNLLEGTISSLTDLVQSVRERAVQAGNTVLTDSQRGFIAKDLEARLNELIGLSNTTDSAGQYLLSGYQGVTQPFAANGTVNPPATVSSIGFFGDDGERLLQVGASRQIPINVSGNNLLMGIKQGNGSFTTAVAGNGAGINLGTGVIGSGTVSDNAAWQAGVTANGSYIVTMVDNGLGGLDYQVTGTLSGLIDQQPFTPGQNIQFAGAQFSISGQPVAGDTFTVEPSTNQSLFQTMQNLIGVLNTPVGTPTFSSTQFTNFLGKELNNLDQALDNISRVRSDVGTRLQELESLTNASEDMQVQHKATLSELQDLDYTAAISEFTQKQVQLEAAQKSFAQVSRLSLFDIL